VYFDTSKFGSKHSQYVVKNLAAGVCFDFRLQSSVMSSYTPFFILETLNRNSGRERASDDLSLFAEFGDYWRDRKFLI
jgi:outer membrane receptor for ferric coprogen and ferric-rhodotorulic acid